jgi:hypothetical protein
VEKVNGSEYFPNALYIGMKHTNQLNPACGVLCLLLTVAFKEICPAGPGYHYSASAIKFNQRVVEQHGTGGPPVISQSIPQTRPQQPASSGAQTPLTSPQQPSSSGFFTPQTRPQQPDGRALIPQTRPQQPSSGGSLSPQGRPHIPAISVTAGPTRVVTGE